MRDVATAIWLVSLFFILLFFIITIVYLSMKKKQWVAMLLCMLICVGLSAYLFHYRESLPMGSTPKQDVVTEDEFTATSITFDEVYHAYEENELKAADIYKGNRYILQGKVNGIKAGRFLSSGGATLTMENNVDGVIVFYYAEFGKDQEDALKTINTGDTITFEGTCSNAGAWSDCELK